jgi:hypothetical protein
LLAQGTIGSLTCLKRDRAAMLRWVISPAISNDAARCQYDYDTVSLDRQNRPVNAGSTNGGRRQCVIYDLAPDDDVYLGPQTSDSSKTLWSPLLTCSGACTNCDSGDDSFFGDDGSGGSGCDCGGAGEYPKIHTDVEDTDPDPDPPVSTGRITPPQVTAGGGHTFTVASNCSDFASQKAAAEADAADGDVAELVLPAGVACTTTGFNLTSIGSGGWVVVRSSADPKLLPPQGTQIDKTYLPFLGIISYHQMGAWGYQDELITTSDSARGYYFENINLSPPTLDSPLLTPLTMTITAIDTSTDTITVDAIPAGLNTGQSGDMVVVDLTGSGVRGGYGPFHACNVSAGAKTMQLKSGISHKGFCGSQGNLADLVGSNCSGSCGTVRRWAALPIEGHGTSGSGNHTITISNHGIPNFPTMTVTGAPASNQLTVSGTLSEYQMGSQNVAVRVAGTSGANCDGLWNITSSGGTLTLSRAGQTPNCTGVSSGTVRRQRAISVFRTNNDVIGDHEPRSLNYNAVDNNTLELLETPAESGVSGGYLFWEMESFWSLIDLGKGSRAIGVQDVVFDRVVSLACVPWLSQHWGGIGNSQHVSLVNSYIEHCMWQRVNPVNGQIERIHGLFQAPDNALNGAQDAQIRNNYLGPQMFLFADDDASGPDVSVDDLAITGNYFWNPDWTVLSTGSQRNHYFTRSFPIELKSAGSRLVLSANYFKGWLSDFQQTAPAIAFSLNGSNSAFPNGPNHVAVEHNIFDRGSALLQLVSDLSSGRAANKMFSFTEKIRIANNLGIRIDTPKYNPGDTSGGLLQASTGYRDVVIERNTWVPERVTDGRILNAFNHRSSGLRLIDNILGFTEGSTQANMGVTQSLASGQIPAETAEGGYAAFQDFHVRGTVTDPLSFWSGNIGIPMLKVSSAGTYSVKAASADPATTHCQSSISVLNRVLNLPVTWVGNTNSPCDQSLDERLNLAFQNGKWLPTATYSGKGADLIALADAHGLPGPVSVTADHDSISAMFHAPSSTACAVDLALWAGTWAATWDEASDITRALDPSPDQEQVVTFEGLNPNTTYAYRGHCGRAFIGQVTTAGAP